MIVEDTKQILRDALMEKEDELQFALREVERVKVNEAMANENGKKLKRLLSEIELAMEEEKHRSLSREESLQKDVEIEEKTEEKEKKENKKEKKEKKEHSEKKEKTEQKEQSEKKEEKEKKDQTHQSIDKKMIGKTCSFSIMKLGHHNHKHTEPTLEEAIKTSNNGYNQENSYESGEVFNSI